jgi:hypothetical protein
MTDLVPYNDGADLDELEKFLLKHGTGMPLGTKLKYSGKKAIWLEGEDENKADVTKPYLAHMLRVRCGWLKFSGDAVVERIEGRLSELPLRKGLEP